MKNKFLLKLLFCTLLAINANAQHFATVGTGIDCDGPRAFALDSVTNILYLCGDFVTANGVTARGVAAFDGANFSPLGIGMDSGVGTCAGPVDAICIYQNNIIVSGAFITADNKPMKCLAKWNGAHWDSIPGWYHDINIDFPLSFYVLNNELYMGGGFFNQGNNPYCSDLVKWDGTNFIEGFTTGLDPNSFGIATMQFYKGKLYCGGYFSDTAYTTVGIGYLDSTGRIKQIGFQGGANGYVGDMVIYHNELYVGGYFGAGTCIGCNYIMRWDGSSWHDVGGGMDYQVNSLAVYGDNLYAGGQFNHGGSVSVNKIAYWDGSLWHDLPHTDSLSIVQNMVFYKNELYVTGDYRYHFFAKYVGVLPNEVNDIEQTFSIFLSPNPASDYINLQFQVPVQDLNKAVSIGLFDVLGKKLTEKIIKPGNKEVHAVLNMSDYKSGAYLLQVLTGSITYHKTIILTK